MASPSYRFVPPVGAFRTLPVEGAAAYIVEAGAGDQGELAPRNPAALIVSPLTRAFTYEPMPIANAAPNLNVFYGDTNAEVQGHGYC